MWSAKKIRSHQVKAEDYLVKTIIWISACLGIDLS